MTTPVSCQFPSSGIRAQRRWWGKGRFGAEREANSRELRLAGLGLVHRRPAENTAN